MDAHLSHRHSSPLTQVDQLPGLGETRARKIAPTVLASLKRFLNDNNLAHLIRTASSTSTAPSSGPGASGSGDAASPAPSTAPSQQVEAASRASQASRRGAAAAALTSDSDDAASSQAAKSTRGFAGGAPPRRLDTVAADTLTGGSSATSAAAAQLQLGAPATAAAASEYTAPWQARPRTAPLERRAATGSARIAQPIPAVAPRSRLAVLPKAAPDWRPADSDNDDGDISFSQ